MNVKEIAFVCHEANRTLQRVMREDNISDPWEYTTEHVRQSAIEGVRKALDGATPEELHESWVKFKEDRGWVYGETKDETRMTHPCLVPYDELPEEQKVKDALFSAIVTALGGE